MIRFYFIVFFTFCFVVSPCVAKSVYQTPKDFVSKAFLGTPPAPKTLWLTKQYSPTVKKILGHQYIKKRIQYWRMNNKSVWILEEIGKEKTITLGLIINEQKIQQLSVLIYREKRGDEVRHHFFTRQFDNAKITKDHELNRYIDGVSGATLSVNALKKLARLALYLDSQTDE